MTRGTGDWRAVCRAGLDAQGAFRAPWLAEAFDAVDRAQFVPRQFWSPVAGTDGRCPVLDRDTAPDAWQQAVWDAQRSAIIQLDDGRRPQGEPAQGDFTSSVSAPNVLFEKLCLLDLEPHHAVLELGTGSGYNTALLCERTGSDNVTTVEVDPELSATAEATLARAGYTPRIRCGDALERSAGDGRYDRILATAALRRIPYRWVAQSAEHAVILAPFGTSYASGGLLKLHVRQGAAVGRFAGRACYMWARSQRPARTVNPPDTYRSRASPLDPGEVLQRGWAQDFAVGLHVPDIDHAHRDTADTRQVQLWDEPGTSVTLVNHGHWWEHGAVKVFGPRDLWAETTAAYRAWRLAGRPDPTRYGATVTPSGQHLWLDDPHNVVSTHPG